MRSLLDRPLLKSISTVAYLFSALAITVATSKGGQAGLGDKNVFGLGVTNYAVSSSCSGAIGDIAIRSNAGSIQKSIFLNGQSTHRPINFKSLGFPNATVLVGTDQIGEGTTCKMSGIQSVVNNGYDESQKDQAFYTLGQLTTFTYRCTPASGSACQIILRELPSGRLEDVYF